MNLERSRNKLIAASVGTALLFGAQQCAGKSESDLMNPTEQSITEKPLQPQPSFLPAEQIGSFVDKTDQKVATIIVTPEETGYDPETIQRYRNTIANDLEAWVSDESLLVIVQKFRDQKPLNSEEVRLLDKSLMDNNFHERYEEEYLYFTDIHVKAATIVLDKLWASTMQTQADIEALSADTELPEVP